MTNRPSNRPKRPYKSFENYILMLNPTESKDFPCTNCDSSGTIRDPKAKLDCVEGYKMAEHISCPQCHGTGVGSLAHHKMKYEGEVINYLAAAKQWDALDNKYRDALRKLTPADRKVLGLL